MGMYDASRVKVGPGTLYAAALGSAEPTSVTGAWPSAWKPLGYTDAGSDFDITPTVTGIQVEEEYWDVDTSITGYKGTVSFALAEVTASNLSLVLNGGLTPSAAVQGTEPDGTIWTELPDVQLETLIMLGWDAYPKGGTTGDPFMRTIFRKCLQSGSVKMTHRKGNNKLMYAASFDLLKPAGLSAVRFLQPASLAA